LSVENIAGNRQTSLRQDAHRVENKKKKDKNGYFSGHPYDVYNGRKSTEI